MVDYPLRQTLARARLFSDYLKAELGAPDGDDWISASDAFSAASPLRDRLVAATQTRLRTTASAIVASALLQSYQGPLINTAIACFLLDRRVPDLSVANVLIHYNAEHEADTITLLSGRFTALPDDPAAGHSDATTVPDLAALRATLRTSIEAHLGSVIDQLCAQLGCKLRGLWLNVADSCADTLVWLMQEQEKTRTKAQIETEVAALVRVPGSPLNSRQIGLLELTHQEQRHMFLDRATCCFWFRTEGGEYCSTCPKRTPEDRRERLLKYLTEAAAGQGHTTTEA